MEPTIRWVCSVSSELSQLAHGIPGDFREDWKRICILYGIAVSISYILLMLLQWSREAVAFWLYGLS